MKVWIGKRELEMDSRYLTRLRDSQEWIEDTDALRQRLQEDGYLLLRGFHERSLVLDARREFLHKLQGMGRLDPSRPLEEGAIGPENKAAMWGKGAAALQADFPSFLQLVEHPKVLALFERLLGGPVLTFDYKWPRAVPRGESTGAHYDIVYMGRGTTSLYTMWTPLGDTPMDKGSLALLLGSQHYEKVKQTYGQMDVDRDNVATGWLSEDPIELVDRYGGRWATTDFEAGDLLIFGMFMMHASLVNQTEQYRISSDTRYQLASEPVDDRWVGRDPKAHYAWGKTPMKSVAAARREWGI